MRTALGIPAFRRLAVGYTLNELCDWMATVALAVLVYGQTGSALATATLFFSAKFLPSLLVPALAVRAERLPGGRGPARALHDGGRGVRGPLDRRARSVGAAGLRSGLLRRDDRRHR